MEDRQLTPPIVITVRYSVLQKRPQSWIIGRNNSFDDYRKTLFDPGRLELKRNLFRNVTLKSLRQAMVDKKVHVVVITSDELPDPFLRDLRNLETVTPRFSIVTNPADRGIDHKTPLEKVLREVGAELYAHVRLDDDDALSLNFADRLQAYIKNEFVGFGVSFGMGVGGVYDERAGRYIEFRDLYYPKISSGLAVVNRFNASSGVYVDGPRTAYELGSHTRADQAHPLIVDSREPAFLYSIYESQDTSGDMKRLLQKPTASMSGFELAPSVMPQRN